MASDAFFPFRDGIDAAAEAGVTAVIQPGGSIRDEEVIAAADEHGMAMVFTGRRHFRHWTTRARDGPRSGQSSRPRKRKSAAPRRERFVVARVAAGLGQVDGEQDLAVLGVDASALP